jgi:molecular chaperone GrpE
LAIPLGQFRAMEERALAAEARLREVAASYDAARRDLEGARARLERDQEQRVREALGRAFAGVLAALDHLELALAHADDGPLKAGVALTLRQLQDALAAEGLERVPTVGLPFDAATSEAVAIAPTSDPAQNDLVVEEYRPAYALRGQLIRAAQVRVAKLS